jgi:UDP-N-acetylglucosamine 2-epimerase (non-hydrolysing)
VFRAAVILVIYGTTGELIKLMPVLRRLQDGDRAFLQASTGQQTRQIPRLLELAGLPPVDVWLARGSSGRDLRSLRDVPGWAFTVGVNFLRIRSGLRRRVLSGPGKPLVLVHGDTMTTLYGATLGRILGFPVAHIESGLRSFDLLHPFPEELNRRLTSRLANLLYAPGPVAASNLRHGRVLDTGSNTIRDSLKLVPVEAEPPLDLPDGEFGIASLHRFELLKERRLLAETISLLRESERQILWVEHPVTVAALAKHGLAGMIGGNLTPIPRLDFFGFVPVMRRSAFLVTDSGGSQEESFYLDIPCLIHRKRTERQEGLGENVVLSEYRSDALRVFLADPFIHRRSSDLPTSQPSDIILADMIERGFAGTAVPPPGPTRGPR